jgi:DNA-binding MarR family transcriptional regulator
MLVRRLRQLHIDDALTMPQSSALARLDRNGPASSSELAEVEQISPQSMGATIATLEAKQFVERSSDPSDGRRIVISITKEGLDALWNRRNVRVEQLAKALSEEFTAQEREQLMKASALLERLATTIE